MRSAVVLVALAGCSSGSDDPIRHTLENEGRICLFSSTPLTVAQRFDEDAPVIVRYSTPGCLSADCDVDRVASCAVTRDASIVSVTSMATWSDIGPSAGICTDDCGEVAAQCTTEPLPAGTYTFTLGAAAVSLAIPSSAAEAPCGETP